MAKMQDPNICCLSEAHYSFRDSHRLKDKGWQKIFHASAEQKTWVAILIPDKNKL